MLPEGWRGCGRSAIDAQYWSARWKSCLPAPPAAAVRSGRLNRSVQRWRELSADVTAVEADTTRLLALTDGRVRTTLPGAQRVRAACYQAFSIQRRSGISRQGLPERRDAFMVIVWRLPQNCPPFIEREEQFRSRGVRPIQVRVAIARHACRLVFRMLTTQDDFDEQGYRRARHQTAVTVW